MVRNGLPGKNIHPVRIVNRNTSNAMQIETGPRENHATEKPEPGSYEWWYFDALNERGEGFTIIFYEGNPFSGRYRKALTGSNRLPDRADAYPALSIALYRNGRPFYYGFREHEPGDAHFSRRTMEGFVGTSAFRGEAAGESFACLLSIDQKLPGGDRIEGEIRFRSPLREPRLGADAHASANGEGHLWRLVQPRAEVEGSFRISGYRQERVHFRGTGYHDHNLGREPMEREFREWYWGRFHFDETTLVYYLMNRAEGRQYGAWLIGFDGKVRDLGERVMLEDSGINLFGLRSARKLRLESGSARCMIQQERLLDNGPFYQRFQSRAILEADGELYQSEGLTEYLSPSRIGWKLFRPLVDMRIVYPGRAHWVQRRSALYRLTW